MKKKFSCSIFLLALLFCCKVGITQTQPGYSTVYLVRCKNFPHVMGNGILIDVLQNSRGYNVFIDSNMVCTLNQYSFASREVPAGKHVFSARLNSKKFKATIAEFSLNIESRKVYYIEIGPDHQKLNSPLECKRMYDDLGSKLIHDLKEDKDCSVSQF